MRLLLLISVAGLACLPVFAQKPANPLSGGSKFLYNMTKNDVLKSAEEMPEADYNFKPADTVRTFGQLVAHVADAQYEFCGAVLADGKTHKEGDIEKTKTSKSDVIQSLKEAFSYCDTAYSSLTDANASDMVQFFGHNASKLTILDFNSGHNFEHYGNMITYLRMKNLVPPSSQHP